MLNFDAPGPEFSCLLRRADWCAFEFDADADLWRTLAIPLDEGERRRAARLVDIKSRDRFIAVRRAMRSLLSTVLELEWAAIGYTFDRGKPALANGLDQRLSFNLSHCDNVALIALHERRAIGVDVELRRPVGDALAMSRFAFTARETAWIAGHSPSERDGAFLRLWTLKEAALKATGSGFFTSPRELELPLGETSQTFDLMAPDGKGRTRRVEMTALDSGRYLAAAAVL